MTSRLVRPSGGAPDDDAPPGIQLTDDRRADGAAPDTQTSGSGADRGGRSSADEDDIPPEIHSRRWGILAVLCICLLVVVIDNTILNVALPDIQKELGATQSQEQWFLDAYTLTFAALLFTMGVLGDRFGRRKALLVGLVVFGASSVACAYAPGPEWLIGFRALMAVGGAIVLPSTLSTINYVFDTKERGKAIGIWAGVSGLAIAIGPITGGALLIHFWWGSVFLVNVPVVIVGVALIAWVMPETKDPDPNRLDPVGVVLSVVGLVALVYGIIRIGEQGSIGLLSIVSIVVGVVVLAAFWYVERRSDHPALDVGLFANPSFSAATAAVTLAFFALFGSTFFLTFYLQFARGYTPFQAGLRLIPVAIAVLVFSPLSNRLVDRVGAKIVCGFGLLIVSLAFLAYQLLYLDTSVWVLEGLLFAQGVGLANTIAPATTAIQRTLPRNKAGAGSAINNTARQVGGALGVAILGSILSGVYSGRVTENLPSGLPAQAADTAKQSIGGAFGVAQQAGQAGQAILEPARHAFIHAMHVTAYGSAGVALLGAVVVVLWLPGRQPGNEES